MSLCLLLLRFLFTFHVAQSWSGYPVPVRNTRYFIGEFNVSTFVSERFPYPLDLCIPLNSAIDDPRVFSVFTCTDGGTTITQSIFNDENCDDVVNTKLHTMDGKGPQDFRAFNCDGEDNYAGMNLFLGSCTDNPADIVLSTKTAVGTCIDTGSTFNNSKVYHLSDCGDGLASLFFYDNDDNTCQNEIPYIASNITRNCSFFDEQFGFQINAELLSCTLNGTTIFEVSEATVDEKNNKNDDPVLRGWQIGLVVVCILCFTAILVFLLWKPSSSDNKINWDAIDDEKQYLEQTNVDVDVN